MRGSVFAHLLGGGEVGAQRFEQRRRADAARREPGRAVEEAAPVDAAVDVAVEEAQHLGMEVGGGGLRRLRGLLAAAAAASGVLSVIVDRAIGSGGRSSAKRESSTAAVLACRAHANRPARPARDPEGATRRLLPALRHRGHPARLHGDGDRRADAPPAARAGGDRRVRRLALPAVGVQVGGRPVRRHLLVGALRPPPHLDLPDAARHDGDAAGAMGVDFVGQLGLFTAIIFLHNAFAATRTSPSTRSPSASCPKTSAARPTASCSPAPRSARRSAARASSS